MQKFSIAIVGGGPAGMVAAISAKRKGSSVVICEKMPSLGKKLLASGNGRCNLSNDKLDDGCYNDQARPLIRSVFNKFGGQEIKNFFKELGLEIYSDDTGRIFPVTNQSASVLKILEMEIGRLSIPLELSFEVSGISASNEGFLVTSKSNKKIACGSLILAAGGKTYPALGSDGNAYRLAAHFSHNIVEPVPAAVPIVVKDILCHLLQGQKIAATAKSIIGGKVFSQASGELMFTKYGLSGTAILDVSDEVSIALNRKNEKDVFISIDMVPFMKREAIQSEVARRIASGFSGEELIAGILPNKFGAALKGLLATRTPEVIAAGLKDRLFKAIGTRGWNEGEFTAGGVDLREVAESTLASKLKKGLYFAGEVLDVNGRRGGYNLAWAWASGFVAGLAV
jgi:hypothetical protein